MAAKVEKNYDASSISILEGLEAVRKRPGMYIGSVSTKGLNHLIYEIADNSVDEHLAGFCDTISVSLNNDGTATITNVAMSKYVQYSTEHKSYGAYPTAQTGAAMPVLYERVTE